MSLRHIFQSGHTTEHIVGQFGELINKGTLRPEEVSLRRLFEAVVGDEPRYGEACFQLQQAQHSSAFPAITGMLVSKVIMDAFDHSPVVWPKLVHDVPSNLKINTVVGFGNSLQMRKLVEGQMIPEGSLSEKYVQIPADAYGVRVEQTEDMILFDQTGQYMERARQVGEEGNFYIDRIVLEAIQDINSNAYRPSGTATALYASGFNNLVTSNALVNEANLDADEAKFAIQRDEKSDPIILRRRQLLVPGTLGPTAWKIRHSLLSPGTGNNAANVYGPAGQQAGDQSAFSRIPEVIEHPRLDVSSTSAWYYGDIKRQFRLDVVIPVKVVPLPPDPRSRLVGGVAVMCYVGCGSEDYRFVCKNTA